MKRSMLVPNYKQARAFIAYRFEFTHSVFPNYGAEDKTMLFHFLVVSLN